MTSEAIVIRKAREHNLKGIDLEIPRQKLVVITGVSGSGKSSLAFDTIYAEGQRRYVESLSSYARQFLGQMQKPDVEYIAGLSPAVAIEQKANYRNPRSTVGTITEIYDYLRVLYARCGQVHCPGCRGRVESQSIDEIVNTILQLANNTKIQILAPVIRGKKGEFKKELKELREKGFLRVRINKAFLSLDEVPPIQKTHTHTIDVIVDRLKVHKDSQDRLTDSIETALTLTKGLVSVLYETPSGTTHEKLFSEHLHCAQCNISIPKIEARLFSFNSPYGACEECHGIGELYEFDPELVIPDTSLSVLQGALAPIRIMTPWYRSQLESLGRHYHFALTQALSEVSAEVVHILLYGSEEVLPMVVQSRRRKRTVLSRFEGIIPILTRKLKDTNSDEDRSYYHQFMKSLTCPKCSGARLRQEALHVTIHKHSIPEITSKSIDDSIEFLSTRVWTENEKAIGESILKEIMNRLQFLKNVGLGYLSLSRQAQSLSGGEMQRIRLASQIGSQLVGVLYVLDEPTIGLHQRDNHKLIQTLIDLKDLGNSVLVVEHDAEMMFQADHIIDLGPGAGIHGGHVIAEGTARDLCTNQNSLTGQYLNKSLTIHLSTKQRIPNHHYIHIQGCHKNNLKNISVSFPLSKLIVVTGVSGSGKSTLINDTLYNAVLHHNKHKAKFHQSISGAEHIDKVIHVDQSPIGRTPRSNPSTYIGFFTSIRELYASLPDSKVKGYQAGRFSFNIKGGRCESCQGGGTVKIEMHFLPDIYLQCKVCKGKRYNQETLNIHYKGLSISDVLNLTVDEARTLFQHIPHIHNKIQALSEVGLGYIHLGQSAVTLSGGEAQRVKLASELSKRSSGRTLYILDEPTTGLHFHDINTLMHVLNTLVEKGNTVIIIEHNLDVIALADYVIDLGPEGGDAGGQLVHEGTVDTLLNNPTSYTAQFLKQHTSTNPKSIKNNK